MLNVYTLDDAQQWDTVVRSFVDYDVYYLCAYARSFALHGDGEPLLIHYEMDDLRGINVVMKRDVAHAACFTGKLPEKTYFDFATPYGYGGWLLEGNGNVLQLMEKYEAWCKENGIVAEFVRFHPQLQQTEALDASYQIVPLGCTVAMELDSEEHIWNHLTSKNRNMIRKAQKNGLTVRRANTAQIYEQFRGIYEETMDRDQADSYYYFGAAFYDCLQRQMPEQCQVFYAITQEGQIAAASIIMGANRRLHYHLSGSRKSLQHLAPTNLLLYEAALWGAENGYRTLHLGGGVGSREDSLLAFKKAFFRGELNRYHIGKKIMDTQAYTKLVALRDNIEHPGFFPAYRG